MLDIIFCWAGGTQNGPAIVLLYQSMKKRLLTAELTRGARTCPSCWENKKGIRWSACSQRAQNPVKRLRYEHSLAMRCHGSRVRHAYRVQWAVLSDPTSLGETERGILQQEYSFPQKYGTTALKKAGKHETHMVSYETTYRTGGEKNGTSGYDELKGCRDIPGPERGGIFNCCFFFFPTGHQSLKCLTPYTIRIFSDPPTIYLYFEIRQKSC